MDLRELFKANPEDLDLRAVLFDWLQDSCDPPMDHQAAAVWIVSTERDCMAPLQEMFRVSARMRAWCRINCRRERGCDAPTRVTPIVVVLGSEPPTCRGKKGHHVYPKGTQWANRRNIARALRPLSTYVPSTHRIEVGHKWRPGVA